MIFVLQKPIFIDIYIYLNPEQMQVQNISLHTLLNLSLNLLNRKS